MPSAPPPLATTDRGEDGFDATSQALGGQLVEQVVRAHDEHLLARELAQLLLQEPGHVVGHAGLHLLQLGPSGQQRWVDLDAIELAPRCRRSELRREEHQVRAHHVAVQQVEAGRVAAREVTPEHVGHPQVAELPRREVRPDDVDLGLEVLSGWLHPEGLGST